MTNIGSAAIFELHRRATVSPSIDESLTVEHSPTASAVGAYYAKVSQFAVHLKFSS
jgi:hypothetical protein